jgi:hypothetical protein
LYLIQGHNKKAKINSYNISGNIEGEEAEITKVTSPPEV